MAAIDHEQFAILYLRGLPRGEIAHTVGCHESYVSVLANRLNLGPLKVKAPAKPPAEMPKGAVAHPILDTGGRYRDLADYADRHGLTLTEAQRLWHQWRMAR